ncbi:MAG: glycosyltransferase family 4 protein [Chloroflexota bacterium]|nr:MAG: hypothetical protein DLM70_11265 [Chloroflexota bacterium]
MRLVSNTELLQEVADLEDVPANSPNGELTTSLHILMVGDYYPPGGGGAARDTRVLCRELVERGHRVTVAAAWRPGFPSKSEEDGVTIYRIKDVSAYLPGAASDPQRRHHPPLPDPLSVWKLRTIVKKVRPDVVHSYGWITYSCAVALLGTDIPLMVSVREYGHGCAVRSLMYRSRQGETICDGPAAAKCLGCASRTYGSVPKAVVSVGGVFAGRVLLRRRVNALHSISTYVREVTRRDVLNRRSGAASRRGHRIIEDLIPCFRTTEHPEESDDAVFERLPSQPFILFVGALRRVKGLDNLLSAYRCLDSPPPLVLMGAHYVDTPGEFPAGVTVFSEVSHGAVMAAWERALFGVAPSVWPEPQGNVVHEGMSKGRPIIGTMPGGMTDMIVDGQSGLLVPSNDVQALMAAMRRLIDDPELRTRLGRAALQRSELFTNTEMMPRFLTLYHRLAGLRQGVHH